MNLRKIVFTLLTASLFFSGCSDDSKIVKTYLIGDYEEAKSTQKKLEAAGFEIIETVKIGKKKVPNIIFTNDHIKKLANRPTRGLLAGQMRLFINKETKNIRLNNPEYFFRAFLQDDYQAGDEKPIIDALMKAFPSLSAEVMGKDSEGKEINTNVDQLAQEDIAHYHYMTGMPYYEDQNLLGSANTAKELVEKLQKKAKKKLLYLIELSPKRYVAGVRIGKRTAKFPKKIGIEKAGLLPWQILIEEKTVDGKTVAEATALDAKYRIALSYPLLSMTGDGSFAGIMTVPGALEKDLKKYFK